MDEHRAHADYKPLFGKVREEYTVRDGLKEFQNRVYRKWKRDKGDACRLKRGSHGGTEARRGGR